MSLDRFIRFDQAPSRDAVEDALVHFLGGFASDVKSDSNGWIATLAGTHSEMFDRHGLRAHRASDERWIEVFFQDERTIDVLTRSQDDATNALATAFAERIARAFGGRLEMG